MLRVTMSEAIFLSAGSGLGGRCLQAARRDGRAANAKHDKHEVVFLYNTDKDERRWSRVVALANKAVQGIVCI